MIRGSYILLTKGDSISCCCSMNNKIRVKRATRGTILHRIFRRAKVRCRVSHLTIVRRGFFGRGASTLGNLSYRRVSFCCLVGPEGFRRLSDGDRAHFKAGRRVC